TVINQVTMPANALTDKDLPESPTRPAPLLPSALLISAPVTTFDQCYMVTQTANMKREERHL
ncbi:MAG: hypothetical protein ACREBR_03560, partial [bacterium]